MYAVILLIKINFNINYRKGMEIKRIKIEIIIRLT